MRFLVDANLSPKLALQLARSGYPAIHVMDIGLLGADDATIFDRAAEEDYVIVTADSDFPMMLALRGAPSPSVILLRQITELAPVDMGNLLLANLPAVLDSLAEGAVVSLSPTRLAVRALPLR